ncbi:MAG: hypothetical protein WBD40_03865 [Tepidisphaeraceae bacterium]
MHCESLENRRLFAVTVAQAYTGYFEIHGDASNDVIDVKVRQETGSFKIDGTEYTGVLYIYVHAGGGDDFISVVSQDGAGMIGASISAGDGSDTIILNFDGSIWAGEQDDVVYIADAFLGEVYGEGGSDDITVAGACIDPEIRGGDGNDRIDGSANQYGVALRGDNGDDTLIGSGYDDVLDGGAGVDVMFGGFGNDVFSADGDGEPDEIFGDEGDDLLYADAGDEATDVEYVLYD